MLRGSCLCGAVTFQIDGEVTDIYLTRTRTKLHFGFRLGW